MEMTRLRTIRPNNAFLYHQSDPGHIKLDHGWHRTDISQRSRQNRREDTQVASIVQPMCTLSTTGDDFLAMLSKIVDRNNVSV